MPLTSALAFPLNAIVRTLIKVVLLVPINLALLGAVLMFVTMILKIAEGKFHPLYFWFGAFFGAIIVSIVALDLSVLGSEKRTMESTVIRRFVYAGLVLGVPIAVAFLYGGGWDNVFQDPAITILILLVPLAFAYQRLILIHRRWKANKSVESDT